jgi:alpha-1,2-rhamnosyltransferase
VLDEPTRILFETTGTFGTRVNTGIQRVVRSLVREARQADRQRALHVVPVVCRNGCFYDATNAWDRIIRRWDRGGHTFLQRLRVGLERVSPSAARLYDSARTRLRKLLYPKSMVRAASRLYWQAVGHRVTFNERDVLLLLDASWDRPIWPAVRDARRRGCRVGAVMYDLLPVEYPQFFKGPFSDVFTDWLDNLIDHSEFMLSISESVRASLEAYVCSSRPPGVAARKRFQSFRLGADVPRSSSLADVRPALRRLFGEDRGQAPYLAVGTIEPRKNHQYLLDAFELLWRRCPAAQLCIVGGVGWECRDVLDRMANHPQAQNSLFVFHDLSDNELAFCYERAKALVAPSIAEGFGLPIVEAIGYGLPAIASDIPVHREVGGHNCRYFDLRSPESLAKLLGDVERRGTPLSLPHGRKDQVITWSVSFRDLMATILQIQSRSSPCPTITPNSKPTGSSGRTSIPIGRTRVCSSK